MTPAPMNTMLQKQPRKEATDAWRKRKSMVVQEVPGTTAGNAKHIILMQFNIPMQLNRNGPTNVLAYFKSI